MSTREDVRRHYAQRATSVVSGQGCSCSADPTDDPEAYDSEELGELPEQVVRGILGCGNPTTVAELKQGDTVLDLGSGGGLDALLSARRVGPGGKVYGLDMTDEMIRLSRENARLARSTNVEFVKGYIEEVPLPDESIDVVISNCVVNLSSDKSAVAQEMFRVLRPGGRIGMSDVVADNDLSSAQRAQRGSYARCVAGALSFSEYRNALSHAGFTGIEIEPTHAVADGIFAATIRAHKPANEGTRTRAVG